MASNSTHQSMIVSAETKIAATRAGDHITLWLDDGNNTMQVTFYAAAPLAELVAAVSGDVVTEFIESTRLDEQAAPCVTCGRAATEAMF
jgi:hypothetical protein